MMSVASTSDGLEAGVSNSMDPPGGTDYSCMTTNHSTLQYLHQRVGFDENYTDRPYVVANASGFAVPRLGFRNVANGYEVSDAWDRPDMERYVITPEDVLKLKSCFDRINRKTKTRNATPVALRKQREMARTVFNNAYLKLKQLCLKTRYRYNMRNYIITPPISQCTHHYNNVLRRLCDYDSIEPHRLQRMELKKGRAHNPKNSNAGNNRRCSRTTNPQMPKKKELVTNACLQKLWKELNETELINKSIKDQTQGGKSFLKQVVIPGKMLNCLYGKVLPDPTLKPTEIGLPAHIMESVFKDVNMNRIAAIVKRDPVFSSDAITTFTKVVQTRYPFITLPSEIITNKQLDFDGDNVSIILANSSKCVIDTLMRLSPKIGMYCYFYRSRLTFSQTHPFRTAGLINNLLEKHGLRNAFAERPAITDPNEEEKVKSFCEELTQNYGKTFSFCYHRYNRKRVNEHLQETLISLSQQYGPGVPYGFVMAVRDKAFNGFNSGRIYPVGPSPKVQALNIALSGSKGTADAVANMFSKSSTQDSVTAETLEYAKLFIEVKTLIRKQGHNAKKMDSAFQNVIVNHDHRLTMKVNNVVYDLGHVINYVQREWVMTDLTINCLLNDVEEDECSMLNNSFL